MSADQVALVGRRSPALAAARRAGLEVLLVAERPARGRPGETGSVICDLGGDLDQGEERWRRCAGELAALARRGEGGGQTGRSIRAVLAAGERSVLPAAVIRRELGLPGLDVATAVRCSDKLVMKQAAGAAGLPCARWVAGDEWTRERLVARLGLPVVLKVRRGSGGRDSWVAQRREELPERLPEGWTAEGFVTGREASVESFVVDGEPRFVNVTEYLEPRWANLVPARLPPGARAAIERLNRRALRALGVERGMTHLEVFLTRRGPVFGELAARPPGGHLLELMELAYGFDPWAAWLAAELGGEPALPAGRPRQYAAVRVLHPGAGRVVRVEGLDEARRQAGVVRADLRLRPGLEVAERRGAGQEVGSIVVRARSGREAERRLQRARECLRIEMEPAPAPKIASAPAERAPPR